jgi:hypothetical protein
VLEATTRLDISLAPIGPEVANPATVTDADAWKASGNAAGNFCDPGTRTRVDARTPIPRASRGRARATANQEAVRQREAVSAALIEARLAFERADSEAEATQAAMARLLPTLTAEPRKGRRGGKQLATQG